MVMKGDLTLSDEHTTQNAVAVLQNCTPETYVILLTNVTTINSTKMMPTQIRTYLKTHTMSDGHTVSLRESLVLHGH